MGHSRPRLMGESGSPSIWTTRSSRTYTFWAQPTAQYGQIDLTTRSAVAVRARSAAVLADFTAAPRPLRSSPVNCRSSGQRMSMTPPETPGRVSALLPGGENPQVGGGQARRAAAFSHTWGSPEGS